MRVKSHDHNQLIFKQNKNLETKRFFGHVQKTFFATKNFILKFLQSKK